MVRTRDVAARRSPRDRTGPVIVVVGEAPEALLRSLAAEGAAAHHWEHEPVQTSRLTALAPVAALIYPADDTDSTLGAIRHLREQYLEAVRIVVTDDEETASKALRHGADAWVSPAADSSTIAATIRIFDGPRRRRRQTVQPG